MASNPRKRPADPTWRNPDVSKTSRLSDNDSIATASEKRRKSIMEAYNMVPHSQRDFNSYASNELRTPKVVASSTSKPLRAYFTLPSQNPAPAGSDPEKLPTQMGLIQSTIYKPAVLHPPHPLSKIGQSGHWVPYPLGLMPYDSWYKLHRGSGSGIQPVPDLSCPVCGGKREVTAHIRKLFLVAERLTWEDSLVSVYDKELNANLNSKLNNELGIWWPIVNDPEHVPGGKYSKMNKFHPYYNEHELMLAFKLLFMTENLTAATWSLWIGMQLDAEKTLGAGEATGSCSSGTMTGGRTGATNTTLHDCASKRPRHSSGLLTPPLFPKEEPVCGNASSKTPTTTISPIYAAISAMRESKFTADSTASPGRSKRIISYRSLQDFYTLLDQIETTSYVGALFLEAYAERLRDDLCKDCWFAHNVRLDVF